MPFKVTGKCGSVKVTLIPAPTGTGLRVEKECATLLRLAGIQNVWSKTEGSTKTKINLLFACFEALKKLTKFRLQDKHKYTVGLIEGNKNKIEMKTE